MQATLPHWRFFGTGWSSSMVKGQVSFHDWECCNGICSLEWYPGGCRLDDVSLPLRWSCYATWLAVTLDKAGRVEVSSPSLLIVVQAFLLLCVRSVFAIKVAQDIQCSTLRASSRASPVSVVSHEKWSTWYFSVNSEQSSFDEAVRHGMWCSLQPQGIAFQEQILIASTKKRWQIDTWNGMSQTALFIKILNRGQFTFFRLNIL